MREKITDINITEKYWAIVHSRDIKGVHSGHAFDKRILVEFNDVLALDKYLSNGSQDAGESMGEYEFNIVSLYTDWDQFQEDVNNQIDTNKERNDEYNKSYDPTDYTDDDSDPDDNQDSEET